MTVRLRKIWLGLAVVAGAMAADSTLVAGTIGGGLLVPEAQAVIGRPLTPMSYAGVARRTTRRVVRRSTIYVATIPMATCVQQTYDGAVVYRCGSTYYQPYGTQYVVVYID
jgi:hypothetical protein